MNKEKKKKQRKKRALVEKNDGQVMCAKTVGF